MASPNEPMRGVSDPRRERAIGGGAPASDWRMDARWLQSGIVPKSLRSRDGGSLAASSSAWLTGTDIASSVGWGSGRRGAGW